MKITPPQLDAPIVDWALWWASRGWPVFPLCSPNMAEHTHKKDGPLCTEDIGKAPMVGAGFKAGTNDPEQIREWWAKWPEANIGSTPPKDWVVVDIDGDTDIEFPETLTHSSGKGKHLIYIDNLTKPLPHGNKVWPNVDTRQHGKGYIVLPPSLHQSGRRYEITADRAPVVFPAELVPDKKAVTARQKTTVDSEIVKLLTMPRDHAELGDDAMAKVAGWVARYAPDKEHYDALLSAINMSLAEPLSATAMAKKDGIWEKHQETLIAKASKVADDEARGWLFELGDTGYSTPIETRDNVDYVPWSDFRVTARGLIILPDSQVWIVDFHRADGSTLKGQRLSSKVLAQTSRLRGWLLDRGMVLHENRQDKRGAHGARLVKFMQSQDPPVWTSRDYYGWCEETESFLIAEGEVTAEDGLRQFTKVYPEDELAHSSPTSYRWEADLEQARDWFKRVLALQDETETAKVGAWLMMLLLRGQWRGLLPGILVNAVAGSGKTVFWQLLSNLAGMANDGEQMTHATARDVLSGNASGFVWLDDVTVDTKMEELIRKAVTQGRITLKEKTEDGRWRSNFKKLRGSIVISGESADFYRQKAQRDRFIDVEFTQGHRTPDAVKLQLEDIGKGSGVLLQECLKHSDILIQLPSFMEGVTQRDKQGQTALRVGARVLDAVMGTVDKYTKLIDSWYLGKAVETDKGNASEVVLMVLPSLWRDLGYPKSSGANGAVMPVWYDTANHVFWINAGKVADRWLNRKGVNERQRQLTTQDAIRKELDACGASKSETKRIPKEYTKGIDRSQWTPSYRALPKKYSDLVLEAADVNLEDDE